MIHSQQLHSGECTNFYSLDRCKISLHAIREVFAISKSWWVGKKDEPSKRQNLFACCSIFGDICWVEVSLLG